MSLLLHDKTDSCQLAIWKMEETFSELCELLPDMSMGNEAVQRFSAPHRRLEWLSVRVLLYQILKETKEICYLSSGKPYLADGSFHISISHTKGYVAVILGNQPVGIDIEQYGQRVHKVAHKYMREDEQVVPYQGDETWSLLLHWSAKEVMFKCLDTADVDFRRHLYIEPFVVREQGMFNAREYRTAQRRSFHIQYRLYPDFVLTWQIDLMKNANVIPIKLAFK